MFKLCALLSTFTIIQGLQLQRAQLIRRGGIGIEQRATYNGGWALGLAGSTCPSDAPVVCGTNDGNVNPQCCPSDQTCSKIVSPYHQYCCPTSADCVNVVRNLPVCANSTWDMYALKNGDGFCCEPDQYDVLPLNGYAGICEPLDVAVAASLVATPASQVGGAAIVTQTRVGGTDATGTITVTSSLANGGGMTTVTTAASATKNTPATTTSLAPGTLPSPSGGATATITLTKGAEIGVAVGAGVFAIIAGLLIWRCLRNRKRRKIAGAGAAPAYSSIPPAGHNGRPVEVGSPGTEYKSPAVGLFPSQFGGAGRAGSDGFVSPNTPPVGHQQVLYGGVGGGQGNVNERYEVPGESRPTMVEAPNTWERGL